MARRLVLLIAALALPLAGFEAITRLVGAYVPPGAELTPTRPDLYTPDPDVGYRLHPSLHTTVRYPPRNPRALSVVSNSDGFRSSRELGEPDARPRILVVGDSFVFGSGVEASERFTEILEWLEPGWRVDNLGMTGWGIDLMVREIETLGPKARPPRKLPLESGRTPDRSPRDLPKAQGAPSRSSLTGRAAHQTTPFRPRIRSEEEGAGIETEPHPTVHLMTRVEIEYDVVQSRIGVAQSAL